MKLFITILLFVGVFLFIYFRIRKNLKFLVVNCIALFTGAPKTGKDALCCVGSHKDYKREHRRWWIRKQFQRLFRKPISEEPLFYTNARTSFGKLGKKPHRLDKNIRCVSLDTLIRIKRFNYKSVLWITEGSLFADNMFFNDKVKNIQLSLFCKLFGHETKGGHMYISTQNPLDLHYAFKRVCSNFYFIQKSVNFFNLVLVCYVREMISNDLGSNNFVDDIDTTTRKVFVPFWWFKRYDRYQFSILTDGLPRENTLFDIHNVVVSFNDDYNKYAYATRLFQIEQDKKSKEVKKQ